MKKVVIIVAIVALLSSCVGNTVYNTYQAVETAGWDMDTIYRFDVPNTLSGKPCDVILEVRHKENYPYQNLWLFVETITQSETRRDTMEVYLADERGRWLGNSKNGLVEMPVLLEQDYNMVGDTVVICVQQGMRAERLRGITDIGIIVYGKE